MNRTYIIAEAGVNHNGSAKTAVQLIRAAKEAGADAVKFQTFKADKLATPSAGKADYQVKSTGSDESQMDMLRRLELDIATHQQLKSCCDSLSIDFLSTPFDSDSLNMLVNKLGVTRLKISSGDVTNAPLILQAARTKLPIILSTGMCTMADIEEALGVLAFGYLDGQSPARTGFRQAYYCAEGQKALADNVVLLHCTTEYPAPLAEVNLLAMNTLKAAFPVAVGYSDHTDGIAIPIAAAAMGARVIEKHFTLSRKLPGPDHRASLEPAELKQMIQSIRQVEVAWGSPVKAPSPSEVKNAAVARKQLVAAVAIKKGEIFTETNLTVKRAGGGLPPICLWELVGKRAERDYEPDERVEL